MRRGPLLGAGLLIFGLLLAYKLAGFILTNDVTSLAFATMAFTAGAIVVAILNNWRRGVYFFLGWLLFEDFARKYLGNNMAIYFAKDILPVAVVYLSFFAAYRRKEKDLPGHSAAFFNRNDGFCVVQASCRCSIPHQRASSTAFWG